MAFIRETNELFIQFNVKYALDIVMTGFTLLLPNNSISSNVNLTKPVKVVSADKFRLTYVLFATFPTTSIINP